MPNRYANDPRFAVRSPKGMTSGQYGMQYAKAQQDRNWANVAQLAGEGVGLVGGTALGFATGDPLAGAGLGLKAGSALGGVGASVFNNQADEAEDPMRRQQMRRQALLQAISQSRGF